ncbi:uncharacterized protein EMH_0014850 [Eimeria mitis]|uniref:RIC1 C-terminal alpha solenoid region domain-containing protein n=1 Tax=Eimeria mitis TaxID=44415 RepID=U6KA63_9EIME|nr:uncharacterized protein EMH_0014850 [Eimeria mitis]CDJ33117.1 hypothetical protein, conserved [Eimeria mitis]
MITAYGQPAALSLVLPPPDEGKGAGGYDRSDSSSSTNSGSSSNSGGLLQQQLQELQQQKPTWTETGGWRAASSAEGLNEPSTVGAVAGVAPTTGGESWLTEGFSTAVDAWRLGSTGSFSDDDAEGSDAEEDHIQPAAAENASTAEEAIRSLPSMITAHRPPNTSPLSVSFCLLLRLPVRPSALCCSSVQRHQQLLLAGCSRQPALFWLDLGGLKQVLGCLYTSDLLRVAKRAGVCPGNAGPPFAAVAASGVAPTAATTAAWSGAAYQSRTTAVPGDWGCPCSACGGRCCCFLERPSLQPMRRSSSRNGGSAPAEATLPSSRRCRCLGRRRLITYLYHPKGYTAVTDLLRLPASAQDAQLLPDLPDVFLCGDSSQDPGWSLPTSLGSGSASTSRRRSRTLRTPQVPRSMGYSSSAECSSKRSTRDDVVGAGHRSAKSLSVREPQRRSTSQLQLHLDALRSSDSSSTANAKSSCNNITTICNSTNDPTVNQAVASRSGRSTTGVRDGRRNPVASVASLGGVLGKPDSSLADRATVAVAAAGSNSSSSSGDTSDDGVSLGWRSSRLTRGPRNARPLELPQQMREVRWPVLRSLTDDTFSNYEALRARCCGGVRQLQLNCRLDILAVVTASGELLLLAWRFPLRGYSEVDECEGIQNPVKDSCVAPQPRKGHFASQQHLQRLEPEFPIAAAAEGGRDVSEAPSPASEGSQLSGGRSTSRRRGCGSISIGAGRDGRVAIGHSAREGFVNAYSASETGHRNSNANMLRPWRPLGLQLRAEGVCCCALNGERSLVAVGLGNGSVEVYRLIWPRNPVQRVRSSRDPHRQQTQQRSTRRIHRDVERDGFTLLPQLLHVITVPDDIRVAAAQQESIGAIRTAAGATCTMGAPYLRARSVQSLQWTADGAALSVRWLRGGTAVFSHTGSILFSLPDPFAAEASAQASSAGLPHPISRPSGCSQRPWQQKLLYSGEVWGDIAATAAAVAAGSAAGSGQLCCWIMGGLSLLHACPSLGANAQLQPDGQCTGLGRNVMFYEVDPKIEGPTSEQLLEVPVVRSASVAVAASSVDVCGSRCASDLTDRVMIGGSHLLVWSFLGNVKASAALSLIPLPPNLYTAKAFPVRQAALSPDGSHMLVSGRRGFALFAMLQRRWRLLCMESQEAQLPTGTLPLGWYTKDIFFVSTPACNQPDAAQSAATAAAAPEPRSTLNAPDAAPRWLLPSSVFHRFEAAVAAAVDFCPSRFAAHVPLTIHEKTAWLQQQQQQYQQSAARLWGAAGTGSGSRELSAVAAGAASRGTGSSSTTMWHYAVLFLSSSERLDLRCRVAEIKRLPARPHTATVLPSLQQQQLLRPAASLGSPHLTVSPRQHDGREERQQEELHHDEPASCGLRVLEEVALKQSTVNGSDPDPERRLSDDKLNPCSREGSSNSSRTTESAFAEQYKARSTRPWPVSTTKVQGSSAVLALHETHSGSSRSNLSAESAAVSPSLFVGPRAPSSTAVPLSPLPFQRIVDFPRPAAVVPARSNRRGNINLYEAQLQHQQEQDPPKHLMRESLEAYARGSSSVLLYSTQSKAAGETAGAAKSETTEAAPTASGGFAASTLRAEPSFVDSEGCGGSGLDSSPATRGPAVAAQLWEARIENCDVCCCCVAGWHLWAQTASGLLLASVGFHYSGTAAAAEAADLTPEHLLAVTDVRLRSALVLPVEARPQPLHIVGVLGELGVAVACTPSRETALGFPIQIQPATQIRLLVQPCTHALLQRQLLAAVACIPVNSRAHFGLVKGRAFDAAAEGLMKELTKCTGSAKSIDSNQDNCSTCKRVFMSVSALRKSPHVFVATLVFCMRKTEPLVSPAVLGSLLQRQVPPVDPITLFTKCLESGLLQTASLYLLPIQTAEGPLQVRCRRVLPLLRAALEAGNFLLVRKLLHFFWAFFRRRHHPRSACNRSKAQQQQLWAEPASVAPVGCPVQRRREGQHSEGQQNFVYKRRTRRKSHQVSQLRSLLWRPLHAEDLNFQITESTAEAGADDSFSTNPWLSRVPLELPHVDRLLAARVYQEVERTVAAAASALLQQQQWLRLFDLATTLALDLPAWLRGHSKGDLLDQVDQRHKQNTQKQMPGADGLATSTAKTVPEGTEHSCRAATAGAAATASQVLPLFSEAVLSFTQQLCIGDTPLSLRLKRPLILDCSSSSVEEKYKQLYPAWQGELQVAGSAAAVLEMACRQSWTCTASLVPPLCSNWNRQQHAAAEIARYLANVLLRSGLPVYTLALAAAARDRVAAAQIFGWYPRLRCLFLPTVGSAWVDGAEGQAALSRGQAAKEV